AGASFKVEIKNWLAFIKVFFQTGRFKSKSGADCNAKKAGFAPTSKIHPLPQTRDKPHNRRQKHDQKHHIEHNYMIFIDLNLPNF
ncbi:hypothetical protein, partial [Neisseria gonorrhoeae]|uniref:hypothetical protein n=1 Tax=Neisseria gonorrhoeae TaxID=485 RepID=UPI001BC99C4C